MIEGWKGGWNTITWLHFENKVDFKTLISKMKNYEVKNEHEIFYLWKKVWEVYKKHKLYKEFLLPKWVNFKEYISSKLLPDNAIFVIINNTMFIVEVKFQKVHGSVDEKLQTCWFKKAQYNRLFQPLWIKVEYCYVLSNWFKKDKYNDTLAYVQMMDCKYFYEKLPLDYLWLPSD